MTEYQVSLEVTVLVNAEDGDDAKQTALDLLADVLTENDIPAAIEPAHRVNNVERN